MLRKVTRDAIAGARRLSGGGIPAEATDAVVIGAGVVGLAIARELAASGRDVLVVESAGTFGTGTSSRNSEVIHAGIYYPPQTLKAKLCVRGKELLYRYCSDREIPHRQIGKLIVATSEAEVPKLEGLMRTGTENGVEGLRMMEGSEAMKMEPELQCVKALFSPSSGIIDSHSLMLSMVGEAENSRTTLSYNTTVIGGHMEGNRLHLHTSESKDLDNHTANCAVLPQLILTPRIVVNSAGLSALPLAKRFNGLDHGTIPAAYYARGCYFTLSNATNPPFSHLIYPIPEDGGLGVHVTLDLNGHVKFGPDVEWIDGMDDFSSFLNRFDYTVNSDRSTRFYPEIRKYYPNLRNASLEPGYSGIRAKLSGPRQPFKDFGIQSMHTGRGCSWYSWTGQLVWHRVAWSHVQLGNCRVCCVKVIKMTSPANLVAVWHIIRSNILLHDGHRLSLYLVTK